MEGKNINGYVAYVRDEYLGAVESLLKRIEVQPQYTDIIEQLNKRNTGDLFKTAMKLIEDVDTGKVKDENMEDAELLITLVLASIQDKVRIRDEKERTLTSEDLKQSEDDIER